MKPFRERHGVAKSGFFSGELAKAAEAAWNFIYETIYKYKLKREDGYHIETRCISLAGVVINSNTQGHWSDNEIIQLLDTKDEVVALAYISRNCMNCAEVIMIDLLKGKNYDKKNSKMVGKEA